jgi:hypothetical protein
VTCGRSWFSPGTPVSSTNKTDHHDINKILLKVALNNIILTLKILMCREALYHAHCKPILQTPFFKVLECRKKLEYQEKTMTCRKSLANFIT